MRGKKRMWIPVLLVGASAAWLPLAAELGRRAHDHDHQAGQADETARSSDPTEALPPKLREMLVAEMRQLDGALAGLTSAVAAGDWRAVEQTAKRMQGSYILKQKLSDTEVEVLHAALPRDFLALDDRFHARAGKLAHAAHERNAELAVFYTARLLEDCVHCHGAYAAKTFPGLASEPSASHRH
jgi:cytochrome c553